VDLVTRYNPGILTVSQYDQILEQRKSGLNPKSSILMKSLKSTREIVADIQEATQTKAAINESTQGKESNYKPDSKMVSMDVNVEGNRNNSGKSILQHRADIIDAVATGRTKDARTALRDMYEFTRSQINKMIALNTSAQAYDPETKAYKKVRFDAYNPDKGIRYKTDKKQSPFSDPTNSASVVQAMDTAADTKLLVNAYNSLLETYGEQLGKLPKAMAEKPLVAPALDSSMALIALPAPATVSDVLVLEDTNEGASAVASATSTASESVTDKTETSVTNDEGGNVTSTLSLSEANEARREAKFAKEQEAVENTTPTQVTAVPEEATGETAMAAALIAAGLVTEDTTPAQTKPKKKKKKAKKAEQKKLIEQEIQDAKPEEAESAAETLADLMPDLETDTDGNNWFLKSFRRLKDSKLLTLSNPFAWIKENYDALGVDQKVEFDDQQKEVLRDFTENQAPKIMQLVNGYANDALNATRKTRDKSKMGNDIPASGVKVIPKKWLQDLQSTGDVLTYNNALPLNLGSRDEKDVFSLDERVAQAAVMATTEWMLQNRSVPSPYLNDEEIAKRLGIRQKTVTQEMRDAVNGGMFIQRAIDEISRKITNLMGVKALKGSSISYTQGIPRALAVNMLAAFEEAQFINISQPLEYVDSKGEKGSYASVSIRNTQYTEWMADSFVGMEDMFTSAFLPSSFKARIIGSPPDPASVARTQMRNPLVKLSPEERKAMARLEATPFRANAPLWAMAQALGKDRMAKLRGFVEVNEKTMNKVDRKSIEGKNRSILRGLNGVAGYMDEAGGTDKPFFFKWGMSSNGRLFQQGPITPQADKYAREMMTATNAVIDMNDPTYETMFWLTVAQSIDQKVHKQDVEVSVHNAMEAMKDPDGLKPAVDLMMKYQTEGTLTEEEMDTMMSAFSNKASPEFTDKVFHAVNVVARLNNASESDKAAFSTSLSLEADGVTDGPVNAVVHMSTGEFKAHQLKIMAMGGLFFSEDRMSLNDYWKINNVDLYTEATKETENQLSAEMTALRNSGTPDEVSHAEKTMRVLHAFLPDFNFAEKAEDDAVIDNENLPFKDEVESDGEFKLGRSNSKNPLTVFIYGAGLSGISDKITSTVTGEIYKRMSEIATQLEDGTITSWDQHEIFVDNPQLVSDLNDVFSATVEEGDWEKVTRSDLRLGDMFRKPVEAFFRTDWLDNLQSSISRFYTTALITAIDRVTGGLQENMQIMQTTASVQAYMFEQTFNDLLAQKNEERKANTEKGRGNVQLSEEEIQAVFEETMKVAPIYETDAQSYHISGGTQYQSKTRIATNFKGKLSSGMSHVAPSEPSVKISPYLTIGTGDGRMVVNIYNKADGSLDTSLAVFDGIELAADNIYTGSTQVNESVYDAWMNGNNFQTMLEGYDRFLMNVDYDKMEPMQKKLNKSFGKQKGEVVTEADFAALRVTLQAKADEVQARKNTMTKFKIWVDHMAGANSPYGKVDEDLTGITHAKDSYDTSALEAQMNVIFEEELAKITADRTTASQTEPVQPANEGLQTMIERVGSPLYKREVHEVSGKVMKKFFYKSKDQGYNNEQSQVFWKVMNRPENKDLDDWRFYFGSAEELNRLKADVFKDLNQKGIGNGQAFAGTKVAFIANASPETMLHEALHAMTAAHLQNYYTDSSNTADYVKDAIVRLEDLLKEFRGLDLQFEPTNVQVAARELMDSINIAEAESLDARAEVMGEFLSWTLSNQKLIGLTKKVKVYGPLHKLAYKVLTAIKEMFGMSKSFKGTDMFSNIRFNTEILTGTPAQFGADIVQEQRFTASEPVAHVESAYVEKLTQTLKANLLDSGLGPLDAARENTERQLQLERNATKAVNQVNARGDWGMNQREAQAFKAVHATMMTGYGLNAAAMREANNVYVHAVKNLKVDDFLIDPDTATVAERKTAKRQLKTLTGGTGIRKDANNRSDLLATFVALSQVSEPMKLALGRLTIPSKTSKIEKSVDGVIDGLADTLTNYLSELPMSKGSTQQNAAQAMNMLSATLTTINKENDMLAKVDGQAWMMRANDLIVEKAGKLTKKASEAVKAKIAASSTGPKKTGLQVANLVLSFGSAKDSDTAQEFLVSALNNTPRFESLKKIYSDLRGMTQENASLMRLINPVKSVVDAMRQEYRERIPEEFAKQFSRKLKKEEWVGMYHGILKTDLTALGRKETLDLIKDPSSIQARIAAEEGNLGSKNVQLYKEKSKALAHYMVTGEVTSTNLLPNAEAIARLLNERNVIGSTNSGLVRSIDRLVSLYAFEMTDQASKDMMTELMNSDPKDERAMGLIVGYAKANNSLENNKRPSGREGNVAKYNGLKGYAPATAESGQSLMVVPDSQAADLIKKGYTRIGDYDGDSSENFRGQRGYYYSSVGGLNTYRQGIAQTVHATWKGVDMRNGQSRVGNTVGSAIVGSKARQVKSTIGRPLNGLAAGEYLMPIFDDKGAVSGYQRPLAADKMALLKKDEHIGRMLGVWTGRIVEENAADGFNMELLNTLKEIHTKHKLAGRDSEFVNLADPELKDPVYKDAWNTMGWKMKEDAAEVFGRADYFPVRRDMIDDALGYRAASITDPWTGITRWSPKTQKLLRDTATAIMGVNAYKYMKMAENGIGGVVSYAKTNIIIRSVVVMYENIVSNGLHLLTHGIGPVTMAKAMRTKFLEITTYVKNKEEMLSLNVQLSAVINDASKANPIKARLIALEDANNQLSIKPLIDAGEFSTISESLTEEDLAARDGKIAELVEKAVDKLPGVARTIGKNAIISKDTALFRVLNRMVQYGDFVGKAVLYDHLIEKRGKTKQEAMDTISEEFVNYNRLPGRTRDALESNGLLWFFNYKLRIQKIAMNAVRERPVTALLWAGGVGPAMDIDSVFSGSLGGSIVDGRIGYAIGPEMGYNGLFLNPWLNLAN